MPQDNNGLRVEVIIILLIVVSLAAVARSISGRSSTCPSSSCHCAFTEHSVTVTCDRSESKMRTLQLVTPNKANDMGDNNSNATFEINAVKPDYFWLMTSAKIQSLNVAHNVISTLNNRSLAYLGYLTFIDLSYNNITEIESGAFQYVRTSLLYLYLHHNPLNNLKKNVFGDMTVLNILDLSYCELRNLDDAIFQDLIALKSLNLSSNSLCRISSQLLASLTKLVYLNLAQNPLVSIESAAFFHLRLLSTLNLSRTRLRFLPDDVFDALDNLVNLDLSYNVLTSIRLPPSRRNTSLLLELGNKAINPSQVPNSKGDIILSPDRNKSDVYTINAQNSKVNCSQVQVHSLPDQTENQNSLTSNAPMSDIPLKTSEQTRQQKQQHQQLSRYAVLESDEKLKVYGNMIHSIDTIGYDAKMPYNPNTGWMTAAVLGIVLMIFVIGILFDKLREKIRNQKRRLAEERTANRLEELKGSDDGDAEGQNDDYDDEECYYILNSVTVREKQSANAVPSDDDFSEQLSLTRGHVHEEDNFPVYEENGSHVMRETSAGIDLLIADGIHRYRIVEIDPLCPLHGHRRLETVVEVYPIPDDNSLETSTEI